MWFLYLCSSFCVSSRAPGREGGTQRRRQQKISDPIPFSIQCNYVMHSKECKRNWPGCRVYMTFGTSATSLSEMPDGGLYTVKKIVDFPVPRRDVTNQTLPGWELFNHYQPGRVWLLTSRLGTGKSTNFFYSVYRTTGLRGPSSNLRAHALVRFLGLCVILECNEWVRIFQKYKMDDISKGVANTLQPAKKIYKKYLPYLMRRVQAWKWQTITKPFCMRIKCPSFRI
jgi:hypothetical protein